MTTVTTPLATPKQVRLARRNTLKSLVRNPLGAVSLVYLAVVAVIAIIGPWVAPHDPAETSLRLIFAEIGGEYLLGGDSAGRDILSRLLVATSYSMAGGLLVAAVAASIGVTGGLLAGYFGRWVDTLGSWINALLMSLPSIIVLIAARAVIGPSMWVTMAIFGAFVAPVYYRVVYNAVRGVRNELYVDAARTSGLSTARIIGRHVLLAVRSPVILLTAGMVAAGIGMQAGFDFLGLGDPSIPTWGQMLNDGFYNINRSGWVVVWPSLALGLTLMALTLLGTAIRDELEGTGDKAAKRSEQWTATAAAPGVLQHEASRSEPLLSIRDLAVAYENDGRWTTVVSRAQLYLERGETHGLVGESGSGKTQTAFAIMGLLPEGGKIVAGSITLDGEELVGRSYDQMNTYRGKRIAYVPQEPMSNLDPSFKVGSQLTDPLVLVHKMSRKEAKGRALELLRRVGIPDPERTFDLYPHQLSGGMAQRVLIAGAVSAHPDVLIADEPTTALDVTVQAEVLDLLRDLQQELDMTILLVTHNFGVVADICDRVSVMQNGVIVEYGDTQAVFSAPKHAYTQSLFDAIPAGAPRKALPGVPGSGELGLGVKHA